MKRIKLYYSILVAIFLISCAKQKEQTQFTDYGFEAQTIETSKETSANNSNINQDLKPYYIMNKQFGMPAGVMQIPKSWKKRQPNPENISFENSQGVKVYKEVTNSFFYSNSQQRNQYTLQNGGQVKPVNSLQSLIDNDLKPFITSQGGKFIKQYPFPELAYLDKQLNSYLFKATPEQRQTNCVVTEWEQPNGNLSMVVIRYFVTQYTSIGGLDWGYTLNSLEAPKPIYENAKNAYLNALVNLQINPNWIQTNNQYYAQIAQQNQVNHQQRMANIKARGQQILAAGRASSQALDNQYNAWKQNQAISDAGHAKYIDGIYERRNMVDPSGNTYKVDGYENNVWMNNNNEYIATDNSLWNPNIDNTTNNYNWQQLEETDNGY